jgi:hypothetical protein
MSYDLYFTKPRISREQFTAYFRARPNYEVSSEQCVYRNQNTGVYFIIDYNDENGADAEAIDSTASLSLNYYRPHIFGLEAVDEIAAFIERFGFSVHDPQVQGMGDGPFSKDGFLRAWSHGNEFGYSAILRGEEPPKTVWTLPGERLEAIWRWNFDTVRVQESFDEDRFVPRVFFMIIAGRAVSVAVWPDAISELVPEVDFLFIGREELAPKSFFGARKKDQILVPFSHFKSALEPYATADYSLAAFKLPAPRVPDELRTRVRTLRATGIAGEGISVDQVLNEEIVAKFKKG